MQQQNINSATKHDFEAVPQISSKDAESIVGWRNTNGNFSKMTQLLDVPGITNTQYERLVEYFYLSDENQSTESSSAQQQTSNKAAAIG